MNSFKDHLLSLMKVNESETNYAKQCVENLNDNNCLEFILDHLSINSCYELINILCKNYSAEHMTLFNFLISEVKLYPFEKAFIDEQLNNSITNNTS